MTADPHPTIVGLMDQIRALTAERDNLVIAITRCNDEHVMKSSLAAAEAELAAIEHQSVVEHEHAGVEGRHAHRSYGEWRDRSSRLQAGLDAAERAFAEERHWAGEWEARAKALGWKPTEAYQGKQEDYSKNWTDFSFKHADEDEPTDLNSVVLPQRVTTDEAEHWLLNSCPTCLSDPCQCLPGAK